MPRRTFPLTASVAAMLTVLAPAAAWAATGDPLREGVRNGTTTRETEIIGRFNQSTGAKGGYVTRQSNTQTGANAGGGAIYGCRGAQNGTAAGSAPCLRASNLADGFAFEFAARGLLGAGLFLVATPAESGMVTPTAATLPAVNPNIPPFQTNAGGEVKNLRAEFATTATNATNADTVDGKNARDIVMRANVQTGAAPTLETSFGATAVTRVGAGNYRVTFERDITGCTVMATPTGIGPNSSFGTSTTIVADVDIPGQTTRAVVQTRDGGPLADRDFNVTVSC